MGVVGATTPTGYLGDRAWGLGLRTQESERFLWSTYLAGVAI